MTIAVCTTAELRDALRAHRRVLPTGGGTKPALSATEQADTTIIDVSGLSGIVEYDPAELTFTAGAGTRLAEIDAVLAAQRQYLPFDPPLVEAGATLGGTIAAGLSGPGAFGHGSVRDFVLGVRFADGTGTLVRGGGKVVKNAAGFDLPKLMVGSMGRLGVLVEISCKVFPSPPAELTVAYELADLSTALAAVLRVARGPVAVEALDLQPPGRVLIRFAGPEDLMRERVERLKAIIASGDAVCIEDDTDLWRAHTEFAWVPAGYELLRASLTPRQLPAVQAVADRSGARVRYTNAANVAWIACPAGQSSERWDGELRALGLTAMTILGPPDRVLLGASRRNAYAQRVIAALDPGQRFARF